MSYTPTREREREARARALEHEADRLLALNGYNVDGTPINSRKPSNAPVRVPVS